MITVITPTNRDDRAIKIVQKALKRQTTRQYEHIIVRPEGETPKELQWTLNRDYNRAIRQAKGELIVSWQDCTSADPNALEKFWYHYTQEPKTLVTAVGNKYTDDRWIIQTWQDPRMRTDQGTFYPCYWNDIEANLCSFPKEAIYTIGGFDEEMDRWYGLDFFNVLNRLNDLGGYDFKIDQSLKSYSIEHPRNEKWDENNWMAENRYNLYVDELKRLGKWPKLSYL